MPASSPDDVDRLERQIRSTRDPLRRALRAVEAHRAARARALRMTVVRRDALADLHGTGMTWQEVADAVGMSLKAVTKAATGQGGSGDTWWKRIPDAEAERHKRGPGGIPLGQVVRKEDLMEAILEVMGSGPSDRRGTLSPVPVGVAPVQLRERVSEHMGREVAMPSLRAALLTLMEDGKVARVSLGRYAPVGADRGPPRRPSSGRRRS